MPRDDLMVVIFNNDFLYGTYIMTLNPFSASPISPFAAKLLRGTNFLGGGCFVFGTPNLQLNSLVMAGWIDYRPTLIKFSLTGLSLQWSLRLNSALINHYYVHVLDMA